MRLIDADRLIDAITIMPMECPGCPEPEWAEEVLDLIDAIPTIIPEKEVAMRVSWTGWKGFRNTRYKCPACKKPVKNDDVYCHRCGQKLMFPHINHTPYVEGQKQELIVTWDDEVSDA